MTVLEKLNSAMAGGNVLLSKEDMDEIKMAFAERDLLLELLRSNPNAYVSDILEALGKEAKDDAA